MEAANGSSAAAMCGPSLAERSERQPARQAHAATGLLQGGPHGHRRAGQPLRTAHRPLPSRPRLTDLRAEAIRGASVWSHANALSEIAHCDSEPTAGYAAAVRPEQEPETPVRRRSLVGRRGSGPTTPRMTLQRSRKVVEAESIKDSRYPAIKQRLHAGAGRIRRSTRRD